MKPAMLIAAVLILNLAGLAWGETPQAGQSRSRADDAVKNGNYKDAFEIYQKLAIDPADAPDQVSRDLKRGIASLVLIERADDVDTFRDTVIAVHEKNWRLLQTAAQTLLAGDSSGFLVGGTFHRGQRRADDGREVESGPRDRVRALQLMVQAMPLAAADPDKNAAGEFFLNFAGMILHGREGDDAWQLQSLTDLQTLPDFPKGTRDPFSRMGAEHIGAPVNEDGSPVFHALPAIWEAAKSDGERWRWCLRRAVEVSPGLADRAAFTFAEFLRATFNVTSIEDSRRNGLGGGAFSDEQINRLGAGPQAIAALKDDETIGLLATGIKRFQLPDEFNFIKLLNTAATGNDKTYAEQAVNSLAQIYASRHQYDRSVSYWKQSIDRFGPGAEKIKQEAIDQIQGNWVSFGGPESHVAGTEIYATLTFRNGKHVHFEAKVVDVPLIIEDIKTSSRNGEFVPMSFMFEGLGRWILRSPEKYTAEKVADWEMDVQPAPLHIDGEAKVIVPIKKAGTYLLSAKIDGGNTSHKLLTIVDTMIVRKYVAAGTMYFIADAATGSPITGTKINLFGYRVPFGPPPNVPDVPIEVSATTDRQGMATIPHPAEPVHIDDPQQRFPRMRQQWILTASTADHRFTHQFIDEPPGLQMPNTYDYGQETKTTAFVVTDRPVYRPGQAVKFKAWIAEPRYDVAEGGQAAKQSFTVTIEDPRGEKLLNHAFVTDAFGGLNGEITLPVDAMLGYYSCEIGNLGRRGFSVEEYKKPEYEVLVDAPQEPVELGQVITATVRAKYYFGQPAAGAKVKYHVERVSERETWYPSAKWDWLYESGYAWSHPDYVWWPGWKQWGHPQSGRSNEEFDGDNLVLERNEISVSPRAANGLPVIPLVETDKDKDVDDRNDDDADGGENDLAMLGEDMISRLGETGEKGQKSTELILQVLSRTGTDLAVELMNEPVQRRGISLQPSCSSLDRWRACNRAQQVIVIDGATVITGSFNFTKQAENSNAENMLVIHNHSETRGGLRSELRKAPRAF